MSVIMPVTCVVRTTESDSLLTIAFCSPMVKHSRSTVPSRVIHKRSPGQTEEDEQDRLCQHRQGVLAVQGVPSRPAHHQRGADRAREKRENRCERIQHQRDVRQGQVVGHGRRNARHVRGCTVAAQGSHRRSSLRRQTPGSEPTRRLAVFVRSRRSGAAGTAEACFHHCRELPGRSEGDRFPFRLRAPRKPESMVRMFGYGGAARLKQRSSPLVLSLAAAGLLCFALAVLSRHWLRLPPLHPYALDVQLAGFVFVLLEMWVLRRLGNQTT